LIDCHIFSFDLVFEFIVKVVNLESKHQSVTFEIGSISFIRISFVRIVLVLVKTQSKLNHGLDFFKSNLAILVSVDKIENLLEILFTHAHT